MTRATLPPEGYHRPTTLFRDERGLVVRVYPEGGGAGREYLFARLHLGEELTESLATGFAQASGPGGTTRTLGSMDALFNQARAYSNYLRSFPNPPTRVEDLTRAHIAGMRLRGTRYSVQTVAGVRRCLRGESRLPDEYRQLLFAPLKNAPALNPVAGYSHVEFRQIRRAARTTVRTALTRIRALERELAAWRADPDPDNHRGALLDHIDRVGDVPRFPSGAVRRSPADDGASELAAAYFPTPAETSAAASLLICMTGQNLSTICTLTDEYLRADAQLDTAGDPASPDHTKVILTQTTKRRRGRYNAEQSSTFTSALDGADHDDAHASPVDPLTMTVDDYATPFGVYSILEELCRKARTFTGTNALLCSHSPKRVETTTAGLGFRRFGPEHFHIWKGHATSTGMRNVDSRRLRRTFVELHQKPVDHQTKTLAREYLAKDPASLKENQDVVRDVLVREAGRIRATHAVKFLTEAELRDAALTPGPLATKLGVTIPVLSDLLSGALDTVAAACVDHTNSPYSPVGLACSASFLMCLECPCARSEPRHIPVQAALAVALEDRRLGMDDASWDAQFGAAHARLTDLLTEQNADVSAAAATATTNQHEAIAALLDGHLDIR